MKTDESPSEAEKEEQKAEASTNTNGKQQERRAFWEKGNGGMFTELDIWVFFLSSLIKIRLIP